MRCWKAVTNGESDTFSSVSTVVSVLFIAARIFHHLIFARYAPSIVYIIRNWDSCYFFVSLCWFCLIDFDLLRSNSAFRSNAWIHFQSTGQKLINWLLFSLQCRYMNSIVTQPHTWYQELARRSHRDHQLMYLFIEHFFKSISKLNAQSMFIFVVSIWFHVRWCHKIKVNALALAMLL